MKIEEYYSQYLLLHQNKHCRRLHVLGNLLTVVFGGLCLAKQEWLLLLFVPLIVYPFAWSGHIFFEKNKPAAWSNPIKAKICDWLMIKDIIIGKIEW